jgi:hypothetical protein
MGQKITSREMTLRNLASDVTSEIREQLREQEILNIPIPEYRDENYAGNSGMETIYEIDEDIKNISKEYSEQGLTRSMTFGLYKQGIKDEYSKSGVLENVSLRFGESPVINPPWQFNELDDVRSNITYPHMGRVYLTYIYSNFPILTVQPGREKMNANMLSFFTKGLGNDHAVLNKYIRSGGKSGILNGIKMALVSIKNTTLGAIEGTLGLLGVNFADASKFITFKPAMKLYRELTNNLLREFAANLGLLDLTQEGYNSDFNFDVVKDGKFEAMSGNSDDEEEYYKEIQDSFKEEGSQDLIPKDMETKENMSAEEGVLAKGRDDIPENGNEYGFFGSIAKLASIAKTEFVNGASKISSTYRGSMRRLDVLDMIPHIAFKNNGLKISQFFGDVENRSYLPFLCQSNISISETFSNSTKEHPIMGTINAMSEEAADSKGIGQASALINGAKAVLGGNGLDEKISEFLNGATKKLAGEIGSQASEMGAIMNGNGKLLVPEIWASSSYSRSYSVDFKFWSPVGDIVSIFENVYIPYLLWVVLAAPLQTGYHSYVSPFVLKVFSKGLFSVDFGMIESLTVTRGDGSNDRTRTNFPRSIKISVSIKDLSPVLMLSLGGGKFWKYRRANSSLTEYIATMCNLSIADRLDFGRKFDTFWAIHTANMRDKFSLNNIGYSLGSSFIFKPSVAWNRNKVTIDQVNTKNIYM